MCNKFITGWEFASRDGIRAGAAGELRVIWISFDLRKSSCHLFIIVQSAFTVPCTPLPAMSANPPALQRSPLSSEGGELLRFRYLHGLRFFRVSQ